MRRNDGVTFILAAGLIFLPSQINAQVGGKINFGNLSIVPGLEIQSVYDDNIYMGNGKEYPSGSPISTTTQEKKESDVITHARPSLFFNYTLPERGLVKLGYMGDFAFYNTNDKNNWKNNQGTLDVNYQAPGGLILGITELYGRAEDPFGTLDQYGIGAVKKRWSNNLQTKVGYTFSDNFRSILYYSNYQQKYDDDLLDYSQNYTVNTYGLGLEARFLPRTWGFVRYNYGKQRYDTNAPGQSDANNADFLRQRASAGVTWDIGAKLSGELNVGYEWLNFDHQFTSTGAQRNDKSSWAAATTITYMPTETTTLGLTLSRTIRTTASDTNEYFQDTSLGVNARQKLLAKLSLMGGLTYGTNDYNLPSSDPRSDTNYLGTVGLNYDIQEWLGIAVGYTYNRKDSNYEANEFVDNQFMASLKIVY